jgi:hypothetical protein
LAQGLRKVGAAVLGPWIWAIRTGYLRSCFAQAAVSKSGGPLPWYTYPAIDFLRNRDFSGRSVLEFGGGQSSIWWGGKAERVITLEGDKDWLDRIRSHVPPNVELVMVSMASVQENIASVGKVLADLGNQTFDIIIIDGLFRREMIDFALRHLSSDGAIICDNAEGYGFHERLADSGLFRVDFCGNAPGVIMPHVTSIYFRPGSCFLFSSAIPIAWDRWAS